MCIVHNIQWTVCIVQCNEVCKVLGGADSVRCGVDISFPPPNGDSGENTSTDGESTALRRTTATLQAPGAQVSPQQSIFSGTPQPFDDLIRSGNSLGWRAVLYQMELKHAILNIN